MYNWHTVKSATHKWKKCSHVCLLTFMLKREGVLGRASVPLKVDWSVPALKSSLSVSSTVRCLIGLAVMVDIVESVASALLNPCYCCLFNLHKVYCFDICIPICAVALHCCFQSCCMCRDMWLHTIISNVLFISPPLFFTAHFKLTELSHVILTWSSLLWLISINSHTL